MKTKASVLTLRIPAELKHKIELLADKQGLSINQLALYTFTKEIAEMETNRFFERRWRGKDKKKMFQDFFKLMEKIPKIAKKETPDWDRLN
jgi:FAD synthase